MFDVRSRRVAVALVTLVAGGALAACGSASSSSTTASSTTASASASGSSGSAAGGGAAAGGANSGRRAQLVSCLKAHGVTLPARPAGSGPPPGAPGGGGSGSGTGTTGTGTSTSPRRGFFFGGGGANISPKMRAAFQACGARFGFGGGARAFRGRLSHTAITNFVTCVKQHGYKLPAPNFSGKGPIFPRNIETSAKFQAAAKACQHLLIPPRPSGGSSGGTSTTSGA